MCNGKNVHGKYECKNRATELVRIEGLDGEAQLCAACVAVAFVVGCDLNVKVCTVFSVG